MSTERKALVRNAADEEQVNEAKHAEAFSRLDELNDLRVVLSTINGRRLLWRVLGQTRLLASVYDDSPYRTAYNAGRQDFGHFLVAEIGEADANAWMLMQREAARMEANKTEPEPKTDVAND